MARYINEDEFVAWVKEHWCTDCQNDNGLRCRACWIDDAIDIVEEAPEADVVPNSEVEKWYHEYHAIKDELKQEKMYHKETEKLVDKYCSELEKSKAEIERLTINMNAYGLAVKRLAEERTEIFTEIYDRLLQSFPAQSFIDAPCTTHDRLFNMVAELKKKYTEGEK